MNPNNTDPAATPPVNPSAPIEPTPTQAPAPDFTAATDIPEPGQTPAPVSPPEVPPTSEPAAAPVAAPTPTAEAPAVEAPAASAFFSQSPDPASAPQMPQAGAPLDAPIAAPTPTGPGGFKKPSAKVIKIAAIVGGVVLLAIIGLVTFFLLTTVSKEDYREAARQYNQVSLANSSLTSDASSLSYATSSGTDAEFDEKLTEVQDSLTKLKTENEALGKLKAVRVGEGAELYGTFNDKLNAYSAYAADLVTSVKNLRPAMVTCASVSDADDTDARVTALKTCSTELSGITDLPNAEFKTFVDELSAAYGEYATVYEEMSALSNPFGAQYEQYKALRDKMYDIQDRISDASTKFSDDLDKRDDELSVKPSAEALRDYLSEQQK